MKFTVKAKIKATARQIYDTWLSSEGHTAMTGGEAEISKKVGSSFTAWDGYIEGKNIKLEINRKITQSWRTTEFKEYDDDSLIEVSLVETDGITEVTLLHSDLPEKNSEQYKKGWSDHYFKPMKKYFSGQA